MTEKETKTFLSKLRQPVHITYISNYLLKKDILETQSIIQSFIDAGIIEESKYGKGYYGLKKENK